MREVEIKIKTPDFVSMKHNLEQLGCVLSEPVEQEDIVFTRNIGSLETFLSNGEFLRIRIQSDGKTFFTYKRDNVPGARKLDKIEYEFSIGSKEECANFLNAIGFKEAVRVVKKRIKTNYKEFEICLDEVKGLGSFMEFEKAIPDDEDADQTIKEIEALIQSFSLDINDQVTEGYDILTLKSKQ